MMNSLCRMFTTLIIALITGVTASQAATPKKAAIVLDGHTGRVLYADNADEPRYPASLTKIMTLYLLFEAIESGDARLDSRIVMTPLGASRPPSKLGLSAGQTLTVEEAILSLVTRSANDVASAAGAFLAGTEEAFARKMTAKARDMGMSRTVYRNASGLPDKEQLTTARDQALLAMRIHRDFPQYYSYFSTKEFRWGRSRIRNHNKLLESYEGTTGIKTGYTNASGYNLTAAVEREGRFLIGVVMGGRSSRTRDAYMTEILDLALPHSSAKIDIAGTTKPARDYNYTSNFHK